MAQSSDKLIVVSIPGRTIKKAYLSTYLGYRFKDFFPEVEQVQDSGKNYLDMVVV